MRSRVPVNEVAGVHTNADGADVELCSAARIKRSVCAAVAEIGHRVHEAATRTSVLCAKAKEATLYGSEKPGVFGSEDDLGTEQSV